MNPRPHWPSPDETLKGVVYLLELDIAGQTHRLATREIEIDSDDGPVRFSAGLLDFSLTRGLEFLSRELNLLEGHCDILIPDLEIARFRSEGHLLAGEPARLLLTVPGRTYEETVTLIRGTVREPEYGAMGEPYTLTIGVLPPGEARQWPPADARIVPATWPWAYGACPERSRGVVYPGILNRPGYDADQDEAYRCSRAYLCQYAEAPGFPSLILVAGHACGDTSRIGAVSGTGFTGDGTGTYVRVRDTTTGNEREAELYNVRDGLGRIVAVIQTDARGSGLALDPGDGTHEYEVRWARSFTASAGPDATGMAGPDGTPITRIDAALEWAFETAGIDYDAGLLRTAGVQLAHLWASAVIEQPVDLVEWLRDNVLPLLPVSLDLSEDGIYPHLWAPELRLRGDVRLEARTADDTSGNCDRDGRVTSEAEPLNAFTLNHVYNLSTGKMARTYTLSGEETAERSSAQVRAGFLQYGSRAEVLENDVLVRDADAGWVAGWKAEVFSAGRRDLGYVGDLELVGVQPGDVVPFTDAELHLVDRPVLVSAVTYEPSRVRLQLILPDDLLGVEAD